MARHDIDKATVRKRLEPRREPYWGAPVERGLYVGFRRLGLGGNWVARYHQEDRTHVYRALGPVTAENDYENAKREARRWRKSVDAGVQTDRVLTVADACRDYTMAIEAEGRARAAVDTRKRFNRIVYDDPIGKLRADKLSQRHLEAWMARLEAGEMTGRKKALPSPATLNRNLTTLKAALNRAVSRREIPQERAIEWGSIKPFRADARRERYLDKAQRRALLDAMGPDLRNLAECVALTGCRPGDPAAMVRKDWDSRNGLATFTTKTGARTIPVSPAARSLFERMAKSKLPGARLFTDDGAEWIPQAWAPRVKAAAAKAELPADVVLYTLRHSWITDAIIGGLDPVTVARLTGTSLEMISKHYGHLAQDAAREKLAQVDFL